MVSQSQFKSIQKITVLESPLSFIGSSITEAFYPISCQPVYAFKSQCKRKILKLQIQGNEQDWSSSKCQISYIPQNWSSKIQENTLNLNNPVLFYLVVSILTSQYLPSQNLLSRQVEQKQNSLSGTFDLRVKTTSV